MIRQMSLEELRSDIAEKHMPLETHSARVQAGSVFVILPAALPRGQEYREPGGEQYLAAALANKPFAVVGHPKYLPLAESLGAECFYVCTEDPREALGQLAQSYYGTATRCPRLVGITGTNGKTTETYLLEALYKSLGMKVGVLGTVSYRWPGHEEDAPLTTPSCLLLHSMLAEMYDAGVEIAFMEVSSHALDQDRVAGLNFSGALLTNLTQDHLDYHSDMEEYFASKARLFRPVAGGGVPYDGKVAALNADDPYSRRLLAEKKGFFAFGMEQNPVAGSRHVSGKILSMSPQGLRLAMEFEGQCWELATPLVGSFNVMNLLGAQALGLALGLGPDDFGALASFTGVSGRLERILNTRGLNAFVDYAHTPDALVKAISALRSAGFARIITVFGCGGNRDKTKRPLMGKAVAGLTDIAVLTSDNPRDEDPRSIMDDVLPGLKDCRQVIEEVDRKKALALAAGLLGPEDALLVAGKGHETYQLIQGIKHPFSDQAILKELLS